MRPPLHTLTLDLMHTTIETPALEGGMASSSAHMLTAPPPQPFQAWGRQLYSDHPESENSKKPSRASAKTLQWFQGSSELVN